MGRTPGLIDSGGRIPGRFPEAFPGIGRTEGFVGIGKEGLLDGIDGFVEGTEGFKPDPGRG